MILKILKDRRFFKFLISGGAGFVVYMASLFLFFNTLSFNYIASIILSYFIATVANFSISKFFVFNSKSKKIFGEYIKFVFIACLGIAFQTLFVHISFRMLGINYYLSNIVACGLFMFISFALNKTITFK